MRVAYVVRSWPRLSQTFVLNEILAVERLGVDVTLFALARSDEALVQPQVAQVDAPVHYLDEEPAGVAHLAMARRHPVRYLRTLVFTLVRRHLFGGYTTLGPLAAFGRAVVVAHRVTAPGGEPHTHVHAHFAHDPALIGLLVHRLTGLPFTFTAHARDLYQIPPAALVARARATTAVVTCCDANAGYIGGIVGHTGPTVELIYHGTDLDRFHPPTGRAERDVPLILSVGRLVEKKGFDTLLDACALLVAEGQAFRCDIYGDGPGRDELDARRRTLGLTEVVRFCGARTQDDLLSAYREADIFVLTPRVTADGDRDGVPNVVVEAMASGLPVVATSVGGIPEVLDHGVNGFVVAPQDPEAVAARVRELLDDPATRRRIGDMGARTAPRYDSRRAAAQLVDLFAGRGED